MLTNTGTNWIIKIFNNEYVFHLRLMYLFSVLSVIAWCYLEQVSVLEFLFLQGWIHDAQAKSMGRDHDTSPAEQTGL